jgi:large subunit ribosomal protein L25
VTLDARELLRRARARKVAAAPCSPHPPPQLNLFKKSGFLSRVFTLELAAAGSAPAMTVPVLPKQVYACAVSGAVEGLALLRCPPDARVRVETPLELRGEDASPGLRKGGTLNTLRRKVRLWVGGGAVPAKVVVDLSALDVGQKVTLGQLPLPEGGAHVEADLSLPVVKVMGRVARGPAAEEAPAAAAAAPKQAPVGK